MHLWSFIMVLWTFLKILFRPSHPQISSCKARHAQYLSECNHSNPLSDNFGRTVGCNLFKCMPEKQRPAPPKFIQDQSVWPCKAATRNFEKEELPGVVQFPSNHSVVILSQLSTWDIQDKLSCSNSLQSWRTVLAHYLFESVWNHPVGGSAASCLPRLLLWSECTPRPSVVRWTKGAVRMTSGEICALFWSSWWLMRWIRFSRSYWRQPTIRLRHVDSSTTWWEQRCHHSFVSPTSHIIALSITQR